MVFKHILIPEISTNAIRFATELIRNNNSGNKFVTEKAVSSLESFFERTFAE